MKEITITVAQAKRNFSECIRRVLDQGVTFVLIEDGKPRARLAPEHEKVCYGRDLAKVLKRLELPSREAKAWRRDLRAAHRLLKAPANKWR